MCRLFYRAAVTELMSEEEGQPTPHLSIAEEIQLLFSSTEDRNFPEVSTDFTSETSELDKNVKKKILTKT